MLLLLDNYDSFTYNLYQYISELGWQVEVVRNDQITAQKIAKHYAGLIISPGPGRPETSGVTLAAVAACEGRIPVLGICLGLQAIGLHYGAKITYAKQLMHGKTSMIEHDQTGLYTSQPNPLEVMRYHSLVLDKKTIPDCLQITSTSIDDNEVMGIRHVSLPVEGIQFHPESIMTVNGKMMLDYFLKLHLRA